MAKKFKELSDADILGHFGPENEALLQSVTPGAKDSAERSSQKAEKVKRKQEPEIDVNKVQFSQHAIDQFVKRIGKLGQSIKYRTPLEFAQKLLSEATERGAIESGFKVERLIGHGYKEVRYFIAEGWRFIIVENQDGSLVVATIERKKTHQN